MNDRPIPLRPSDEPCTETLLRWAVSGSLASDGIDDLAVLAARICDSPTALVSLLDHDQFRITSVFGEPPPISSREQTFCVHVFEGREMLVVPETTKDHRFKNHPVVTGDPGIRFYAGAPLMTADGILLGVLCVMDNRPRDLNESQRDSLRIIADQVAGQLRVLYRERESVRKDRLLHAIFDSEPECVKLLGPDGSLRMMNRAGLEMIQADFAQVEGKCVYPLIDEAHREAFKDLTRRVFAGESGTLEFQIVGLKGRPLWLETHATPLLDEAGEIEGLLSITRNITDERAAEEVRIRREASLATAQSLARLGSWECDLGESTFDWSAEQARLHGCADEPCTKTFAEFVELVHPEDRNEIQEAYRTLQSLSDTLTVTYRTNPAGGDLKHLKATLQVINAEDGKAQRVEGATLDITETVVAEERIRQLNRVHSMMSSINQQVVRETDLQTFLDAACGIAVEKGQFGMAWIGLIDGADQKLKVRAHSGASDQQLQTVVQTLSGKRPVCDFTYDAVRTGRQSICNDIEHDPRTAEWRSIALDWGFYSMASLPLTDGDRVIGTLNLYSAEVGFFNVEELQLLNELAADVSFAVELSEREEERRRVERALRESETQLSNALKIARMAHWGYDLDTGQFILNDQFFNLLKTSVEGEGGYRMSKSTFLERFCHPDDLAEVRQITREALALPQQEHTCSFEHRSIHGDGSISHLAVQLFVEKDEHGETINLYGVNRDITERKLLEEELRQSQKMEAIGQLAGGVAHDFNNILTVISGYGTMLMLGEIKGEQSKEAIQQIVEAAERAGSLTRQLLAFSRRQVMQPKVHDLNELIAQLTKMLRRIVGEHIKLKLDLTPEIPAVYVDAGMLDQLILNLAVNARDAMPDGGELRISTSESAPLADQPDAHSILLEISDTGCGIAPDTLERIFEPFFTTKAQGKGTGLGLATVFGIVKQHDGKIDVQSEVGKGTSFTIRCPVTEKVIETAASSGGAKKPALERGSETILLVEDEPAVRMLGRGLLERAGYHVLEACDGTHALEVFNENRGKIQLLFTDIVMPEGVSGRDLAARLRESQPDLRVIFTSGYSAEIAGRELGLEVGQNFVQKPSSPQFILQTVRHSLDTETDSLGLTS